MLLPAQEHLPAVLLQDLEELEGNPWVCLYPASPKGHPDLWGSTHHPWEGHRVRGISGVDGFGKEWMVERTGGPWAHMSVQHS